LPQGATNARIMPPRGMHEFNPQLLPRPGDPVNSPFTRFPTVELIDRGNAHACVALPLAGKQTA
jgi:hypothetical protein